MISLANVANAYNPALLLLSVGLSVYVGFKYRSARGVLLVLSAVIVYALMFMDKRFSAWAALGLDYSTHTATALAMCIFIATTVGKRLVNIALALSLALYCCLMVFLNYHSWIDILTTGALVGTFISGLYYMTRKSKLFVRVS